MSTHSALMTAALVLLIGWVLCIIALCMVRWIRKKEISLAIVFKDFGQKLWMTAGLGVAFFGLYFFTVYASSHFTDAEHRLALFFLVRAHPVFFVYFGLGLFILLSAAIYLVRLLIIYLCNKNRFF